MSSMSSMSSTPTIKPEPDDSKGSAFDSIIRTHRHAAAFNIIRAHRTRAILIPRGPRTLLARRHARGVPKPRIPVATIPPHRRGPPLSRRFNPDLHGYGAVEDAATGLRRLETDPRSVVVAVDGACSHNGFDDARGSFGVFFSEANPDLNRSGVLPDTYHQTNQVAELHAAVQALEMVHELMVNGYDFTHLVLKTNSANLEKGLSLYIWKWARNGFRNKKESAIVNGRAFKYLHERIWLLEKDYGMQVSFCLVAKELNQQADWLAKQVLKRDLVHSHV